MKVKYALYGVAISITFLLSSCDMFSFFFQEEEKPAAESGVDAFFSHEDVIETSFADDLAYVKYDDGIPDFSEADYNSGEYYIFLSELDDLGRVGVTQGLFDYEHFPTEERGSLSSVTPTGWHNRKYDSIPGYLMNRCHTLGYQFSALGAEERALIAGTRFFNIEGNLPFENMISDHMRENNGDGGRKMHQVLVRVTPDFYEDNLFCHGVVYDADCIDCDDIDFSVYMFNKQPGIVIDYRTGENWESGEEQPVKEEVPLNEATYILNIESKYFHTLSCSNAPKEDSESRELTDKNRATLIAEGFVPCSRCKP